MRQKSPGQPSIQTVHNFLLSAASEVSCLALMCRNAIPSGQPWAFNILITWMTGRNKLEVSFDSSSSEKSHQKLLKTEIHHGACDG